MTYKAENMYFLAFYTKRLPALHPEGDKPWGSRDLLRVLSSILCLVRAC